MPIVRILGPEAEHEQILELLQEVKKWVSSVQSLEITPQNVTPIFVPSVQENPGESVIFYIDELFTRSKSGRERVTDDRTALSKAIEKGFNEFVADEKLQIWPNSVTVVIYMVDPYKGEYYYRTIPARKVRGVHSNCAEYGSALHMMSKSGLCPSCNKP